MGNFSELPANEFANNGHLDVLRTSNHYLQVYCKVLIKITEPVCWKEPVVCIIQHL